MGFVEVADRRRPRVQRPGIQCCPPVIDRRVRDVCEHHVGVEVGVTGPGGPVPERGTDEPVAVEHRRAAGAAPDATRDLFEDLHRRSHRGVGRVADLVRHLPITEGVEELSHYRAVLEVSPKNALAMNNLAWLLVKQAKPGGLAMAQQANQTAPDKAQLLDTLAMAQAADGQLAQAVQTQKKAVERAPQDPNMRLQLARLYLKADNKAFARAELEEVSSLGDKFPDQAQVRDLLKQAR